jgi:hypothetical protein
MTTTPEQIEAVARAMWMADVEPYDPADRIPFEEAPETARAYCLAEAIAAIDAMRPFIRDEVLEEAANIIERLTYRKRFLYAKQNNEPIAPCEYAAAIRALKGKP